MTVCQVCLYPAQRQPLHGVAVCRDCLLFFKKCCDEGAHTLQCLMKSSKCYWAKKVKDRKSQCEKCRADKMKALGLVFCRTADDHLSDPEPESEESDEDMEDEDDIQEGYDGRGAEEDMSDEEQEEPVSDDDFVDEENGSNHDAQCQDQTIDGAYSQAIPTNTKLISLEHARVAYMEFVNASPTMRTFFTVDEEKFAEEILGAVPGLLAIRAAFTNDEVFFCNSEKMHQAVTSLRHKIRNINFTDLQVMLLSCIHLVQMSPIAANALKDVKTLQEMLLDEFEDTHPMEMTVSLVHHLGQSIDLNGIADLTEPLGPA